MTESHKPTGEFPMPHHPGIPTGLRAYAQPSHKDGTFASDRAGRRKVSRVHVRAQPPTHPHRPDGLLGDSDWKWATTATRRWSSIVGKLAERAEEVAVALARTGCVSLIHDYENGTVQQPPRGWLPHPELTTNHTSAKQAVEQTRQDLRDRAERLHDALTPQWPGAASALTRSSADAQLTWLIRAAEDLLADNTYDGPRAFVQHHAGNTKARDDLPRLLAEAGFEPEALAALGVDRSPYIGVGGPIQAHHQGRVLDWTGWPGPHDIRLPAHQPITLTVTPGTQTLLVIENRQAAEALCDSHPDTAVVWCHGQPSQALLDLIRSAATNLRQVVICPDADLGGVRIAARIHDHLPSSTERIVVDIGNAKHDKGTPFSTTTRDHLTVIAQRADDIGTFASQCLERGYRVEQEASARVAVQHLL